MSVRTDVINLQVNVNNNQAQNQLNELRKKAKEIAFEMDGLKKNTQAYINKKAELKQVTSEMDALKKQIGLTALSQKELTAELNKLKALRGSTVPFTKEFKDLSVQIQQVENRLYDVRNGVQGFASFFSKISDSVKQFGLVAAGYLGFQFISSQFQNIIAGAGKISDQLADLRRVAGLTADEANKLNSALSKVDTRTAVSSLRDIAVIAGKLGVAKDDILSFTEATDKLVVSLGDELGYADQITTALGKILNVFDGKITGENITTLGNAIVDLANKGVATGGFIVDFTTRLAGLSGVANISKDAAIGLAAGLEELGLRSESSTTAVITILSSIATDVPGFAKAAGKSVEEFSNTLANKPIEALIQVSEGLSKNKKGFQEISAAFSEAGADGARVISTLGVIGTRADFVRGKITEAGTALQETSAITEAFALKNETFGATLDKLGKDFTRLVTSPAVTDFLKGAVEGAAAFINVLTKIPKFISDNSTALQLLAAGIALLNLQYIKSAGLIAIDTFAKMANAVATRTTAIATAITTTVQRTYAIVMLLVTGRINAATAAQLAWLNIMRAGLGPIGILITVISAAVIAFNALARSNSAAAIASRTLQEVQSRAANNYGDEIQKIRELTNVLKDHTISRETQEAALKQLIALNPEYLNGLTLENIATAEGTKLLDNYVESLKNKAYHEAAIELQREKIKEDIKLLQQQEEIEKRIANGKQNFGTPGVQNLANRLVGNSEESFALNQIKKQRAVIQQELKVTDDIIKEKYKIVANSASTGTAEVIKNENDQVTQSIGLIKKLQDAIKKLDDERPGLLSKDAIAKNLAERKKLQDELDALEGKKSPEDKSSDRKLAQLKKEADAFTAELKNLRAKANAGLLTDNQREIALVEEKYRELIARARKYWTENSTIGKEKFAEIAAIRDAQLELLMKKQLKKADEKDYADALKGLDSFFDKERNARGREYAAGKLTKKEYEKSLNEIEASENNSRIVIALRYAATVKKAAADLTGFQKIQQKQQTDDLIEESEKRKKTVDEQLAAARLKVLTSPRGSQSEHNAKKDELQLKFELETKYMDKTSNMYLEKQAELNNQFKDLDRQRVDYQIEEVLRYVNYFTQALTSLNQIITNRENRMLQQDRQRNDQKKKNLKNQLDNKLISQGQYEKEVSRLQEEQDRRERELKRKQAKREKALAIFGAIVNTAGAIAKALNNPYPLNIVLAAIAGVLGGLQIAAIASQPLPELGKGGLIQNGPQHKDSDRGLHLVNPRTGRTEMLLENGEGVLSKKTMESNTVMTVTGTPKQIASGINAAHGGSSFAGGAFINYKPMWMKQQQPTIRPGIVRMMAQGGIIGGAGINEQEAGQATALMQMQIAETQALRNDLNNWQKNIKAHVVLKDLETQDKLYKDSKKASSLDQ